MLRPERDTGKPGGFPPMLSGPLSRRCSDCGAAVGVPCVKKKRPWETGHPHPVRRRAT